MEITDFTNSLVSEVIKIFLKQCPSLQNITFPDKYFQLYSYQESPFIQIFTPTI